MPAYVIGFVSVTDRDQYAEYMKATPSIIARFGGRFIARGGRTQTLEGPEETRRVVILEFPTFDQAIAFYHSEQYEQAKKLRAQAATATFILVEGWVPPSV